MLALQVISFIIIVILSIILFFVSRECLRIKRDYNNLKNRILDSFRDKLSVDDKVSIYNYDRSKIGLNPVSKITIKGIYDDYLAIHYVYNDPYIDGQLSYILKSDIYPLNWFD